MIRMKYLLQRLRKWTADLGKHGLETWNLRLRHRLGRNGGPRQGRQEPKTEQAKLHETGLGKGKQATTGKQDKRMRNCLQHNKLAA